jgi:vacuolar-type H+-ATPase subunit I/STV1
MKQSIRKFWVIPVTAVMSLAIVIGVSTTRNVYAIEDGTTTTVEHEQMTETEHSTSVENKTATQEARTKAALAAQEARTKAALAAQERKAAAQEHREAAREKLSAAKLKLCEARQANITNRTARIADRGAKQLTLFTTIAERVQAFYTSKGKTLANYDELVAAVASKKAAAQSAVDSIAGSTTTLNCNEGNPKQVIDSFKSDLQLRHTALIEYKTAVKNLIVGVKSVNSTTTNDARSSEEKE